MKETIYTLSFLLPIALFFITSLLSKKEKQFNLVRKLSSLSAVFGFTISIGGVILLFEYGMLESATIGIEQLGFSLRIDPLTVAIYTMVNIIALVVLRFSYNYLDGDKDRTKFIGKLAMTIGFVQLLILSGNLLMLLIMWIATSIALHQLLIFYPNRLKARIAARKKFILARLGDATLLTAVLLLYRQFGTGNLEEIFIQLKTSPLFENTLQLEIAVLLLVITAGLKSVQVPFHGWILEVMETPTPVSALLHAGLLNAGPFLMIRFAYLLEATTIAPLVLFTMGAITAIYGALVFTSQATIKTALAYSSIGHMGFTLMLAGLGLYAASLLHLMAHSFYKAHSFLTAGSVIEKVQTNNAAQTVRSGNILKITFALVVGVGIYLILFNIWEHYFETPLKLQLIGGIVLAGVLSLLINALDSNSSYRAIGQVVTQATLTLISFFVLEEIVRYGMASQIPAIGEASPLLIAIASVMVALFLIIIFLPALLPVFNKKTAFKNMSIHFRNGLYINVLFDRLISSLKYKN